MNKITQNEILIYFRETNNKIFEIMYIFKKCLWVILKYIFIIYIFLCVIDRQLLSPCAYIWKFLPAELFLWKGNITLTEHSKMAILKSDKGEATDPDFVLGKRRSAQGLSLFGHWKWFTVWRPLCPGQTVAAVTEVRGLASWSFGGILFLYVLEEAFEQLLEELSQYDLSS